MTTDLILDVRLKLYGSELDTKRRIAVEVCEQDETAPSDNRQLLAIIEKAIVGCADAEDGGTVVLNKMLTILDTDSNDVGKLEDSPDSSETNAVLGSKSQGTIGFRKDFKFNGRIAEGQSSDSTSYISFMRQVQAALKKGYAELEIIDGVIRAIQPSCKLRGYLEGRESLNLATLQKIIRTFYKERSSTELYQLLCNLVQEKRETPQDFIYRALDLRQKIIFASRESTFAYDAALVEEQFKHAIATGLRDDQLRTEVQPLLKIYASDEELVQGLMEAHQQLEERRGKISEGRNVKSVSAEHEDNTLVNAVQALRIELNEIKESMGRQDHSNRGQKIIKEREGAGSGYDPHSSARRRRNACKECVENNVQRCFHCFHCGSAEHYKAYCPTRQFGQGRKQQGNGMGSLKGAQ